MIKVSVQIRPRSTGEIDVALKTGLFMAANHGGQKQGKVERVVDRLFAIDFTFEHRPPEGFIWSMRKAIGEVTQCHTVDMFDENNKRIGGWESPQYREYRNLGYRAWPGGN